MYLSYDADHRSSYQGYNAQRPLLHAVKIVNARVDRVRLEYFTPVHCLFRRHYHQAEG